MGTDIHLVAETKNRDGRWELVPGPVVTCWRCDGAGVLNKENSPYAPEDQLGQPCTRCSEFYDWGDGPERNDRFVEPGKILDEWYSDRHYTVFGYLADVRNGSGFAGCDLGDAVKPIAEPRGFPDYDDGEMSDEAYLWFRHHGGDHTDTWLSLEEILAYDWDSPIVKRGVVNAAEYTRFLVDGKPDNWCGDISGPSIRKVSNAEMSRLIAAGQVDPDNLHTQVQWTERAGDAVQDFLDRMHELLKVTGEQPARIIFNFDS